MQTELSSLRPEAVHAYRGKTVLVVGAARSGLAAAELLLALGAKVLLNDSKPQSEFPTLPEALNHKDCALYFGTEAEPLFALCDMLLISPGISIHSKLVEKARAAGLPVIGELGFAASCATQDLIAVTGTNGKTTTVSLIGEILSQAGHVAHVAGNIGYPLSAAVLKAKPEDTLVAEVSSFQMETAEELHPKAAALLNLTPDHLDRHGSMENYIALKMKLFSNMTAKDHAILNHDDPLVVKSAKSISAGVTWFSLKGDVNRGLVLREGKITFLEKGQYHDICPASELKIPGKHNIENALAAAAVAVCLGVPLPVIAYALKNFMGVEHRIEFTREVRGVKYLNDSKGTNPDSTVKAVESMSVPTILIAGGFDKQVPFDSLANAVVNSRLIKGVVLLGQTKEKIAEALKRAGYHHIMFAENLEDAVRKAAGLAAEGETVLFSPACSSFDMFHGYEERGRIFKSLVARLTEEG